MKKSHGISLQMLEILNNIISLIFCISVLFYLNKVISFSLDIQFYRVRQIPFSLEHALKKSYWIFSQISFFYLKVQSFPLIMENNFIQMAASAGQAGAYMSGPIFNHIIDCMQWLHEYCPLKRQLSLAYRRNTYLRRHPTNNNPTVSNRSSKMAKRSDRSNF